MMKAPWPHALRVAVLSAIAWGIPIPLKDYPFIASVSTNVGTICAVAAMAVKNHTFFVYFNYSLMSMLIFQA
ncbi:hypothetical protein [Kosakonia arachidis]|uniref:hypothetical protein n=1 Tax=Kosakonia arachidis TaxID=551989 RepID=UPI000B7F6D4C|nr:hypothetical protein [Kosakonia arachidis]